ncbi:MAG: amidase [Haloarculaceae archaeon]
MTRSDTAAAVRSAAATYGIDLTESAFDALVDELGGTLAHVASLDPDAPDDDAPADVREGTDDHNAFTYRFTLDRETGGPLSDLDVAVKDNVAVAGVPMTCGSDAVEFTPDSHATVVHRLAEAGAAVVGTTNMDEFAYFTTGETCAHGSVENPAVEGGVPGGSSAGSGAAVAAGDVAVALGSDTGGSIRIPASFCGVVGFKPTHGAVPRSGFADLSPSLDHVGPLADTVENAARALEVIGGMDTRDPSTYDRGPRRGVVDATDRGAAGLSVGVVTEAIEGSDEGITEQFQATVERLEAAGVAAEPVSLDGFADAPTASSTIISHEFSSLVANGGVVHGTGTGYSEPWRQAVVGLDPDELGELVTRRLVVGRAVATETRSEHYVAAQNERRRFLETVHAALTDHDALVLPTTPMTAPGFGEVGDAELTRTIAHTAPFNLTGHPAISVPCGEADGAPVGFQAVAGWDDERVVARVGAAVEGL